MPSFNFVEHVCIKNSFSAGDIYPHIAKNNLKILLHRKACNGQSVYYTTYVY
jgi:hypothetical protein